MAHLGHACKENAMKIHVSPHFPMFSSIFCLFLPVFRGASSFLELFRGPIEPSTRPRWGSHWAPGWLCHVGRPPTCSEPLEAWLRHSKVPLSKPMAHLFYPNILSNIYGVHIYNIYVCHYDLSRSIFTPLALSRLERPRERLERRRPRLLPLPAERHLLQLAVREAEVRVLGSSQRACFSALLRCFFCGIHGKNTCSLAQIHYVIHAFSRLFEGEKP